MTSITIDVPSQTTLSFVERVSKNFADHKWEIIAPGPMGLASLVATIVFLVSNPFGWMISAGMAGASIAFASLSAIGAIGYSLYFLLKEPIQLKNSVTIGYGPPSLFAPKPTPEITPPPPVEQPVIQPAAPKEVAKKKPIPAPKIPASKVLAPKVKASPHEAHLPFISAPFIAPPLKPKTPEVEPAPSLKERVKNLGNKILNNPIKSALVVGGLLLGGYCLYAYLTGSAAVAAQGLLPAPAAIPLLTASPLARGMCPANFTTPLLPAPVASAFPPPVCPAPVYYLGAPPESSSIMSKLWNGLPKGGVSLRTWIGGTMLVQMALHNLQR